MACKVVGVRPIKAQRMQVIGLESTRKPSDDGEQEFTDYAVVLEMSGSVVRFPVSSSDYDLLAPGDNLAMVLQRVTDD